MRNITPETIDDDHIADIEIIVKDQEKAADDILNQNLRSIALWGVVSLLIVNVLLILFIYFKAVRPMVQVNSGIHAYMETKDSAAVKENLKDISRGTTEIGLLSQDFMGMTGEIDQYVQRIQTITADRERRRSICAASMTMVPLPQHGS